MALPSTGSAPSPAPARWRPPTAWIGICPAARKNHAVFFESKYSALAKNVTLRVTTSGMKNESQNDWWLGTARTAGPFLGIPPAPPP